MFNKLVCSLLVAFALALYVPLWASGADSDIPPTLSSFRARLLQQRDRCLRSESDQNRCLSEDETTISAIDRVLVRKPDEWQGLVEVRARRARCIANHRMFIAQLRGSISDIDKQLCSVESDIKAYATLR